ncbi:DNA-3-methyladenine glycosylase 2 family protein, partial [Nocardioides sp.]
MQITATRREQLDFTRCYTAVRSRDRRFDGVFYTAVRTTGIYCRPSCPARTPAPRNVSFHATAAAAQAAGYRACKRCLPDATPGSPDWDVAATVAGRAMRLIADGVVDREGVDGLAARLGYSPRHLSRLLRAELGAGPLALARTQRAQTARALVESTELGFADVAFAAGFASVRQFNETIREVYDATPSQLRGRRGRNRPTPGAMDLRIAVRTPFAGRALLRFLADRAVPGIELADVRADGTGWYARTLELPQGPGVARVELADSDGVGSSYVPLRLQLHDLRDTAAAVARMRALVDADADPVAVDDHLAADPALAALVRRRPGLRV